MVVISSQVRDSDSDSGTVYQTPQYVVVLGAMTAPAVCGVSPTRLDTSSNCGLKSECDAGWGLDWAERKTCPLNVCCSKYGFCGTTDEFCGEDDKFKRPSCDKDSHRIERVIGYYEQWSLDRPCNTMSPEAIPAGYYTHINFAFAGIDPETFEIRGSASRDNALWKRIQSLRLEQPGVEIWIALGGWVFNDPEQPTRTTFSDIARSVANQRAFAKSLLSMMRKYGFDGVDIEWEYPVAEERSGREEDYKNFPKWMKNLRALLHSSGKKYGLSLTLPASYWYLQHFDVKKLEESVDWLNVMTYDMHGTWDKNNTWVGPFINPHTNLTEIKNSMDLLWRNDINPDKVVMGMAYYGRSFTLADPGCTDPGCVYRSGGAAGECSETVGFLLNSEIQDKIKEQGLTPTLYEEDAVKAVAFGDQWVSFDDKDTFKIRGDYARSQCMGGVMVWAISHDDRNYTSAKALTSGIGRTRMDFPNYPETPPERKERQEALRAAG
ncbi:glycoside hydrolase [Aspergillus stella-maris]|uniref:glycoside hydrolase n=1 Tax=Aspergillus stella-maris TaxID=1810926 RepID=UPI003CCD414E